VLCDAMLGQSVLLTARDFHERIGLTGVNWMAMSGVVQHSRCAPAWGCSSSSSVLGSGGRRWSPFARTVWQRGFWSWAMLTLCWSGSCRGCLLRHRQR